MRRTTIMLRIPWIAITFSYGLFAWIPSLLVEQGMTTTKSFGYSIVIYLAQIPGYYSAAFLSEKLDRNWTGASIMIASTPEPCPTAFRTTGMGVASSFGRIGGLSAPIVIGYTFREIGFSGVFVITTIALVIGAAAVTLLGIGTAGKSREQITAEELDRAPDRDLR